MHPVTDAPRPIALASEEGLLRITWSDGVVHRLPWRMLRDRCPCATCKVQPPAKENPFQILSPSELLPLRPTAVDPVGNYAYNFHFSDGHSSGIYSFEYLRQLGQEAAAKL